MYGGGATAGAVAAAAMAQATKAAGGIVKVEPDTFLRLVNKSDAPLVIMSTSKFFSTSYKYLTSYRGFFFFTKSSSPLNLPGKAELINANTIWVPA